MKKLYLLLSVFGLLVFNSSFGLSWSTDNQIQNIENQKAQDLNINFKLQKFSGCDDLENTILKYVNDYSTAFPWFWGAAWGWIMYDKWISTPLPTTSNVWANVWAVSQSQQVAKDYSETNIQVAWVDESDIVKNDGDKIYYFNSNDKKIYIVKAFPANELKVLKTIKIPDNYTDPELYLIWNKLTIIATKYDNLDYGFYWFQRNTKTVVVVYDISDLNNLIVDKYYQVDWNYVKSRRIGDFVYILSSTNFSFPYSTYFSPMLKSSTQQLNQSQIKSDFSISKVLPKKAELRYTSDKNEQNYSLKWKVLPYNLTYNSASACSDVEYFMPDTQTLKKYSFNPSLVTLSIIDTKNKQNPVKNKVLFWDVSEIYMSLDNLYITSNLYTSYPFKCRPGLLCAMPFYQSWENTLIHKLSINGNDATYQNSTIVSWTPLSQYSMDENSDWLFRIVTSNFSPERTINLYTFDKNLWLYSSLENIVKWESFQSVRFIGDKLYLVSFKQIDPMFVIDLSNAASPKILWVLKIPGYSTYLHPYDANHLIWIGYDTNSGWTQTSWIKVDLYDVSDFSNPKQQFTLTLGDNWSYSEALNNPKLFVWNSQSNTLFLPVTLYKNANDPANPYRNIDAFQWGIAIKIDKDSGIKELARVSHIEATNLEQKRTDECKIYATQISNPPACQKIIGWWEYCPPVSTYVPPYCYQSSPIWEYFSSKIWDYNNFFVLRNLYFDNFWYTISNSKIQVNDTLNNFSKVNEINY